MIGKSMFKISTESREQIAPVFFFEQVFVKLIMLYLDFTALSSLLKGKQKSWLISRRINKIITIPYRFHLFLIMILVKNLGVHKIIKIYNKNVTQKNIKNIIYKCKSKNILLSHFFTATTRALLWIDWKVHISPSVPLLHLTRLWHVERFTALHYYFYKSIKTTPTLDF